MLKPKLHNANHPFLIIAAIAALFLIGGIFFVTTIPVYAEGPRCASESSNGDRVVEGSCGGYYTGSASSPTPYNFEQNKCYYIERPSSGPNDFDIQETPCDSFEDLLRSPPGATGITDAGGDCRDSLEPNKCNITKYLKIITNVLAAVVGVVVAIMLVVGGIQYSMSGDNPQATAAAKGRITNAVIALIVYIFATAILQYLIPGGLF